MNWQLYTVKISDYAHQEGLTGHMAFLFYLMYMYCCVPSKLHLRS